MSKRKDMFYPSWAIAYPRQSLHGLGTVSMIPSHFPHISRYKPFGPRERKTIQPRSRQSQCEAHQLGIRIVSKPQMDVDIEIMNTRIMLAAYPCFPTCLCKCIESSPGTSWRSVLFGSSLQQPAAVVPIPGRWRTYTGEHRSIILPQFQNQLHPTQISVQSIPWYVPTDQSHKSHDMSGYLLHSELEAMAHLQMMKIFQL